MGKWFIIIFFIFIHTQSFHSIFRMNLNVMTIILFMILFLIKMFNEKDETVVMAKSQLFNLILCYFIFISSIHAGFFGLILTLLKISVFIFIPFLFVHYIYKNNLLTFTLKWFVIFTVISSAIAILQEMVFLWKGKLLIGFVEPNQLKFMMESTSYGFLLRVPGFFGFHYPFVYYLLTSAIILFNYLIYKQKLTQKEKISFIMTFLLIFIAIVLTFCHDALIAIIFFLMISVLVRWPAKSIHFITGIFLILFLIFISGYFDYIINEFLGSITWGETRIRVQLAKEGIEGFFRHPWIGVGFENSSTYTSHYYQWPPHNAFIQAADEIGIFGFLSYCSMIIYILIRILKLNLLFRGENGIKGIIRGLLFSFMIYIFLMQSQPHAFSNFLWIMIGIIEGAVLSLSNPHGETIRIKLQTKIKESLK